MTSFVNFVSISVKYLQFIYGFIRKRGQQNMGKIIGEGITFDDVLLVPAYSEVIPNEVDL